MQKKLDARGKAGPQGLQGIQGLQGEPGPTSAGVGGINASITPAGMTTAHLSPTTVTLDHPGKVLVLVTGTFEVTCGLGPCSRTIGVNVGGTVAGGTVAGGHTVPGAFGTVAAASNVGADQQIVASGIVTGVDPGTHAVTLVESRNGNLLDAGNLGDVRLTAIALGG